MKRRRERTSRYQCEYNSIFCEDGDAVGCEYEYRGGEEELEEPEENSMAWYAYDVGAGGDGVGHLVGAGRVVRDAVGEVADGRLRQGDGYE